MSTVGGLGTPKEITGVRADYKYADTAVDPILGKVYAIDAHYTQETIWGNIKERLYSIRMALEELVL